MGGAPLRPLPHCGAWLGCRSSCSLLGLWPTSGWGLSGWGPEDVALPSMRSLEREPQPSVTAWGAGDGWHWILSPWPSDPRSLTASPLCFWKIP